MKRNQKPFLPEGYYTVSEEECAEVTVLWLGLGFGSLLLVALSIGGLLLLA